jgi:WD40 repeat protein
LIDSLLTPAAATGPQKSCAVVVVSTFILHLASLTNMYAQPAKDEDRVIFRLGSPSLTSLQDVSDLAMFPKSGRLLSSGTGTIDLWDTKSGRLLDSFRSSNSFVESVSISPDETRIAAVLSGAVVILDGNDLASRNVTKLPFACTAVCYSPNGEHLAVESKGTVKLVDSKSFEDIRTVQSDSRRFHSLRFSDQGHFLAGATAREIVIWNPATGKVVSTIGPFDAEIASFAMSPKQDKIAVTCGDGSVTMSMIESGKRIAAARIAFKPGSHQSRSLPVLFLSDSLLVTGDRDGVIRYWDVALTPRQQVQAHSSTIVSFAVNLDGTRLYSAAFGGLIKRWDTKHGTEELIADRFPGIIGAIAVNRDSTILAMGVDAKVLTWDLRTGRQLNDVGGFSAQVLALQFSNDGRFLAASATHCDSLAAQPTVAPQETVRVWDVATWSEVFAYKNKNHGRAVLALKWFESALVFSEYGDPGSLQIWDVVSRKKKREAEMSWFFKFDISKDGDWLIGSCFNKALYAMNARLWKVTQAFDAHTKGPIQSIVFHPRENVLFTSGSDSEIRIWDVERGKLTQRQKLITKEPATNCVVSPNGMLLAVGDVSGRITIWDWRTERQVLQLSGHLGPVDLLEFVGNDRLISHGRENTCVVWSIKNAEEK